MDQENEDCRESGLKTVEGGCTVKPGTGTSKQ